MIRHSPSWARSTPCPTAVQLADLVAHALRGGAPARVSQAERLTRLSEILVALFGSPIPTHLFQTLGDRRRPPCRATTSRCVCRPRRERLSRALAWRPAREVARGACCCADEGLPGRAMSTGQPFWSRTWPAADGAATLEGVLAAAGLRAALVVPVRRGLEVLGALLFAAGARRYGRRRPDRPLMASGLGSRSRRRAPTRRWPTSAARWRPCSAAPRTP